MHSPELIKEHIKNMLCPVHDIHPIVEHDRNGLEIACCCSEFENSCLQEAVKLMRSVDLK
jgi:hypothetical protein